MADTSKIEAKYYAADGDKRGVTISSGMEAIRMSIPNMPTEFILKLDGDDLHDRIREYSAKLNIKRDDPRYKEIFKLRYEVVDEMGDKFKKPICDKIDKAVIALVAAMKAKLLEYQELEEEIFEEFVKRADEIMKQK